MVIEEQLVNLKNKAFEIVDNIYKNEYLHSIPVKFKKVPGTYYYHYIIENNEILSIIKPTEWEIYNEYLGCYFYNYDNIFYKQN